MLGACLYDSRDKDDGPYTDFDNDAFAGPRVFFNNCDSTSLLAGTDVDVPLGSTIISAELQSRIYDNVAVSIEGRGYPCVLPEDPLSVFENDSYVQVRLQLFFQQPAGTGGSMTASGRIAHARIAVIGGGPGGLMAAETLAKAGQPVTLYEAMPSFGRKLLMAGRGGLNLTHSEPLDSFLTRYRPASPRLAAAIDAFPPAALTAWSEGLGQPTFVGSSGRVFPRAMKASPLLRAWLARLTALGVELKLRHRWLGWDTEGALLLQDGAQAVSLRPPATLLSLGGASWPRLGSDGAWVPLLARDGIEIAPLRPANCGFQVAWSTHLRERFAGQPLKPVALTSAGQRLQGECLVTAAGLEGGAIYALSAPLREAIAATGQATLTLDLRPHLGEAELTRRLSSPGGAPSLGTLLRKAAGLSPVAAALLREVPGPLPAAPAMLARRIKALPLVLTGTTGIERAISTAGGVTLDALDDRWMLRRRPGVFVAGEMLDWEAPTGGYLLQATFATAVAAAEGLLDWLDGAAQ